MSRTPALAAASILVLSALACSGPDLAAVPEGTWGGDHIRLEVAAADAQVELDCAHGAITGRLVLDDRGHFDAPGVFVREHGGPVRQDETPDLHPAHYTGSTDGRTLHLTITLDDQAAPALSFRLGLGQSPRLFKCL